jgi:hypothetical protein
MFAQCGGRVLSRAVWFSCGSVLANSVRVLMHVDGGVLNLVRGREIWTECSRSHNEVDAHCLVSRQVNVSRRNKFGGSGGG